MSKGTLHAFISSTKAALKWPFVEMLYRMPDGARRFLFVPGVRRFAGKVPVLRAIYSGWDRPHPIDRYYGTDTSGLVEADQLQPDASLTGQLKPYMGSQPSIVRRALQALPGLQAYCFIDFGCGKGRPMIVASEFPFARIMGVDISGELVSVANHNARRVARRFPDRAPMQAVCANVRDAPLPPGRLVVFLYNPFGEELITALLHKLEAALEADVEHLFIVYNNPVYGHVFDASPALTRWFAQAFHYEAGEIGYGPDFEESVVIWQSTRGALTPRDAGRHRPIVVRMEAWSAAVE